MGSGLLTCVNDGPLVSFYNQFPLQTLRYSDLEQVRVKPEVLVHMIGKREGGANRRDNPLGVMRQLRGGLVPFIDRGVSQAFVLLVETMTRLDKVILQFIQATCDLRQLTIR